MPDFLGFFYNLNIHSSGAQILKSHCVTLCSENTNDRTSSHNLQKSKYLVNLHQLHCMQSVSYLWRMETDLALLQVSTKQREKDASITIVNERKAVYFHYFNISKS